MLNDILFAFLLPVATVFDCLERKCGAIDKNYAASRGQNRTIEMCAPKLRGQMEEEC